MYQKPYPAAVNKISSVEKGPPPPKKKKTLQNSLGHQRAVWRHAIPQLKIKYDRKKI